MSDSWTFTGGCARQPVLCPPGQPFIPISSQVVCQGLRIQNEQLCLCPQKKLQTERIYVYISLTYTYVYKHTHMCKK